MFAFAGRIVKRLAPSCRASAREVRADFLDLLLLEGRERRGGL